MVQKDFMQVFE